MHAWAHNQAVTLYENFDLCRIYSIVWMEFFSYLLFLAQFLGSGEATQHILTQIDKLGLDGYKCIAVGRSVNCRLDIVGLLPFIDELRSDSAKAVDNLIDMDLSVIVLTGDLSHHPLPPIQFDFHINFFFKERQKLCRILYQTMKRKKKLYKKIYR